jgi:hypothetical protein
LKTKTRKSAAGILREIGFSPQEIQQILKDAAPSKLFQTWPEVWLLRYLNVLALAFHAARMDKTTRRIFLKTLIIVSDDEKGGLRKGFDKVTNGILKAAGKSKH